MENPKKLLFRQR